MVVFLTTDYNFLSGFEHSPTTVTAVTVESRRVTSPDPRIHFHTHTPNLHTLTLTPLPTHPHTHTPTFTPSHSHPLPTHPHTHTPYLHTLTLTHSYPTHPHTHIRTKTSLYSHPRVHPPSPLPSNIPTPSHRTLLPPTCPSSGNGSPHQL